MNLLFIAEDTSKGLDKNFYFLEQELATRLNVMVWRRGGHIDWILKQIPYQPDFILLLNDIGNRMSPMIKGLGNVAIPSGLFVNDVHRFTSLRRNYIHKNKIPYIFPVVRGKFIETYPEFEHKMQWLPHFIHPDLYQDYGLKKEIDLLMMGAANDFYPLRQKIIKTYKGDSKFTYHPHPGYRTFREKEEKRLFIGTRYAKEINRAAIFFTSPSVLYYPVAKYFEVLACKTLLLAPTFRELEDLGFIPGYHFVPIDEYNFKEKAAYYLENRAQRQKIAEQGYHFVHKEHTIGLRGKQLVKKLERILKNERRF
ncbi:glycosyltransferase [Virgibacillus alimentarius]|uniref:Glycosyltransferase involved in cell wall biosynthesis n=1 Tax=Virgibacillus alimentarius TaxID=698769 RepID=A0ABS4SAV6_9BACI|nr:MULTISPECIES: glycosyltransferase [Virgibacillus]MBP2258642.1 glycosyltransferase involved in cell wall biosynthesis [Virgibacillus alimentarius]HLR66608.1 glycosyltransferase [Virgibacillus sp.]